MGTQDVSCASTCLVFVQQVPDPYVLPVSLVKLFVSVHVCWVVPPAFSRPRMGHVVGLRLQRCVEPLPRHPSTGLMYSLTQPGKVSSLRADGAREAAVLQAVQMLPHLCPPVGMCRHSHMFTGCLWCVPGTQEPQEEEGPHGVPVVLAGVAKGAPPLLQCP